MTSGSTYFPVFQPSGKSTIQELLYSKDCIAGTAQFMSVTFGNAHTGIYFKQTQLNIL